MYENVYYVRAVTEDVVGASAYDDAWFGVGEFVYEVALCLVYAVGGVYVVSQPRHRVEAHGERYNCSYDTRSALVVLLKVLEVVACFLGGFYEEFFVVETDAESFGYESAEGAASAAECASYGDYVSVG